MAEQVKETVVKEFEILPLSINDSSINISNIDDDYYYNDFVYTFMVFDSNNMDEPIYICDEFRTDSGAYLENYFYASDIGLDEFDPSVVYMMVVVDEAGDIVAYGTSDYDEFESIPQ